MKTIINTSSFDYGDDKGVDFFNAHGWVVINNLLSTEKITALKNQYSNMKVRYAKEAKIDICDYEAEITQWRDLWLEGGAFKEVIFDESGIQSVAQMGMAWQGIRLLHDHIITKPSSTSKNIIPWHQDSMFWPVDLPGCSTWTPLVDTPVERGCLEVIDSSHLNGCSKPLDFMAKEKDDFSDKLTHFLLPVKAGSTVLLHSLTWHRSSPNNTGVDRPVHIALWLHTNVRWRPDLVDWHPVNNYVNSKPGKLLKGDMFPAFGIHTPTLIPTTDIHSGTEYSDDISMFNSGIKIASQLSKILEIDGSIDMLLKSKKNRQKIIKKTIQLAFCDDQKEMEKVLYKLWIDLDSYRKNKSRNVYNLTTKKWWELAGKQWDAYLKSK